MPRLTFRTKLLLSHVGLVAAVVLLVSVLLERSLGADLEAQLDERLVAQARGSTEWVSAGRHPERVAARLSAVVRAEVVIFDREGRIIGESGPVAAGDAELPEVAAARRDGVGRATRTRPGSTDRVHYVAVPTDDGLVVRLGVPASEVEAPAAAMRGRLVVGAIVAAVAALVLGLFASRLATRPLRTMAESAARIARGDYDVELPKLAPDEFGVLADTLAALARQLKADMERIRKLEITRRDFVANVTHELRTPVAAISGYAETLLGGNVDREKAREFVDMMFKHAQRISNLVDGLLRLSELEAAPPDAAVKEPVDVAAIARDVAETLRARASKAEVAIDIDVVEPCLVHGDPTRLEQVIENLVDNAIKYADGKGRVSIEAASTRDRVQIGIRDDGPGIEPQHLERLFERFYRVDSGRSRERGGAGLGLSIVKHLVESMGGSVSIESEVGRGTRFAIDLPRSPDSYEQQRRGSSGPDVTSV